MTESSNLDWTWKTLVICFENCSDLLWQKIVVVNEKNFWKFEAEGQEFDFFWENHNVQTVKGQNKFWNRTLFELVTEDFKRSNMYIRAIKGAKRSKYIIGMQKPKGTI